MSDRYFKCIKQGGCRLTDLELNVLEDQLFKREISIADGSNSIRAALNSGWIEELTEEGFNEDAINRAAKLAEVQESEEVNPNAGLS